MNINMLQIKVKQAAALLAVLSLTLLAGCGQKAYRVRGNEVTVKVAQPAENGAVKVRLQVLGDKLIRVSATPDGKFHDRSSLVIVPQAACKDFEVVETADGVCVKTAACAVEVRADGSLWHYDGQGQLLQGDGQIRFTPVEVEGKKGWSTCIQYGVGGDDESFYGLGQQQSGEFDHKGRSEELYQYNTKVSVPFVVSTRGYGLLFDAYSWSRWGNPEPYRQLGEVFKLYDKDGVEGALTGTYTPGRNRWRSEQPAEPLVRREDSLFFENEWAVRNLPRVPLQGATVVYEGYIEAPVDGDYHFTQYYAGFQRTEIGGEEKMSRRWRAAWNPNSYKYTATLKAGEKTPIRIEWEPDGGTSYLGLRVADHRTPEEEQMTTFWSEFEPQEDFYFIAGEDYDDVIHGYRTLTGKAPVMPKWSLGFWQSREHYATQDELVGALAELRRRGIPVDNIVQDWQYWEPDQWGSHEFDKTRYPDPEKMLDDVHAMHGRFMISVWPKFYTNTEHYKELKDAGYVYLHAEQDSLKDWLNHYQSFYDAYAEGGRKMFWRQMDETLYSRYGRKIDAWWMDASEPNLRDCLPWDYFKWLLTPNALGSSTEYFNAYALVNADAIYNGQRGVDPDKRVFLLTRNGFAGLQRYSTATWSGDIGTSWEDMRIQMSAGLNYSMSGIPFWGMDIGGFTVMSKFYSPAGRDEWQELQTRWHQFGAFVPLFRAHGQSPNRELYNIAEEGSPAYNSILYYMKLRYRLMPYLYSLTAALHFDDYTLMRGLPMDFPEDPNVRDLDTQWMFGPAFMPCPVYEYGARSREVYFPEGAGWYDFYTGSYLDGGVRMTVAAPYERMPLYVRAGSIVPTGPEMQWSDEKAAENIRLHVYAGRDADFNLYEDDGLTYAYEKGAFACIPMHWDDASRTLTLGARTGSFPGMLAQRTFTVVVIDPDHPKAFDPEAAGQAVTYDGSEQKITF